MKIFDRGMRPGEVFGLTWQDVDFVRGVVLVTRGKSRKSRRHLPMSQRVRNLLIKRAARGKQVVFPSPCAGRNGLRLTTNRVSRSFTRLKKCIGLAPEIVLYSSRHTFATDFMDATGDISKTSRTLGHDKTSIAERYLHPAVADLGAMM